MTRAAEGMACNAFEDDDSKPYCHLDYGARGSNSFPVNSLFS